MQGILLIDKPADWTSFDVVNYVRRLVARAEDKKTKNVKVGHSGTLDPFATGLLVLLIGKSYTSKANSFLGLDKTYEITMKLGQTSSTGDPEGDLTPVSDTKSSLSEINNVIAKYRGQIEQTPPRYSAIKVDGERAYKLARANKEFEIKPRQVEIKKLEVISYNYPEVKLISLVSSGTYIRSLVEDIGKDLGVGAYTLELRRTTVGKFKLSEAHKLPNLQAETIGQLILT